MGQVASQKLSDFVSWFRSCQLGQSCKVPVQKMAQLGGRAHYQVLKWYRCFLLMVRRMLCKSLLLLLQSAGANKHALSLCQLIEPL